MAHTRLVSLVLLGFSLLLASSLMAPVPLAAAPWPHASLNESENELIAPVCHRGWRHHSGRPCYRGYRWGPPPFAYAPRPYYRRQICRWRTNEWGQAVRVCWWR